MSNYDFLVLSPDEFELFCKDILEVELNIKLENFKTGKDSGIDLRYAPSEELNLIVQCKRYRDIKSLMKTLKNEVGKVKKLNPSKYILMTSVPLNPAEKDSILECFEGYIKSTGDIFGKDELQAILANHHSIERKHYKLWLASTNTLKTILHNEVYNRSKFTEEQIKEKISMYVPNDSLKAALEHIERTNVIILSGGPGVGKTTLADMLYLNYSSQGYELIEVTEDIEEGEKLYNPELRQLFYYDDFLGRNFLNYKLSKNEDRRIVNFIKKVMKEDNKIFIMTTREYILNQAQINYDLLDDKKIDINKLIIDVESFTKDVKAKVLYNHLFFSDLPEEFIGIFVKERTYREIISHRNYNPRLISRMTSELDYQDIDVEEYPIAFIKELDYPYNIWQHVFENQVSEYSRWILRLLLIMGDKDVALVQLEKNFSALNYYLGRPFESVSFKLGIKELEKTFLKITVNSDKGEMVWFLNPSIADFLIQYSKNSTDVSVLWNSTRFFFPMFNIFSFSETQGKITIPIHLKDEYLNTIINRFEDFADCRYMHNKIQAISKLDRFVDFNSGEAREILVKTFSNYAVDYSDEFADLLIKYKGLLSSEMDIGGTFKRIIDNVYDYNEVLIFMKLYDYFRSEIEQMLDADDKSRVIKVLVDDIEQNLNEYYDYEEVIGVMEELGGIFDINVSKELLVIEQRHYENSMEPQFEPDYEEWDYRGSNNELHDEDDYVDDLFESLLHK